MKWAPRRNQKQGRRRPRWAAAAVLVAVPAFALWLWAAAPPTSAAGACAPLVMQRAHNAKPPVAPSSDDTVWPACCLRDPFARAFPGTVPEPAPVKQDIVAPVRVGGILYGHPPAVLMNGVICREGDLVTGYRVVRIDRDKVVLERKGVLSEHAPQGHTHP